MMSHSTSLLHRLRHTRLRDALRGRINGNLDWRQAITVAGLPDELAGRVHEVVRRTWLWRGEKADVARELIAHFQDGLEAGRTPENLLNSFGDPVLAARLIRRAKKRGRPMAWQIWRYGWWTLGGLILVYVAAGLWMMAGRPSVKTDYLALLNKQVLAAPEDERAWPLYRDALLAMGINGKAKRDLVDQLRALEETSRAEALAKAEEEFGDLIGSIWSEPKIDEEKAPLIYKLFSMELKPGDKSWPQIEKFLTDHTDSIVKLREAASRKSLGFAPAISPAAFPEPDRELFGDTVTPEQIQAASRQTVNDQWLISLLVPNFDYLRDCAALLQLDARRAAHAGDGETALADIIAILGISRHCEEIPLLICAAHADSRQKTALVTIQEILSDHGDLWTTDQLRDLAHQLAMTKIDWRRGIQGERNAFYDCLQRMYTDNGRGNGRLALYGADNQNVFQQIESIASGSSQTSSLSQAGLAMLTLPAANMVVASRKEMTAIYDRFTSDALQKLETPLWEKPRNLFDVEMGNIRQRLSQFRYLLVNLLFPSYSHLRNRIAVLNGEREGVFLGLALEMYHREHGKWPATLSELAPRWIPQVPVDRINGRPLHYKVVDDHPIVYSVGVDADDDGSRMPWDDFEKKPDNSRASPFSYHAEPIKPIPGFDGDWVLWSTSKSVDKPETDVDSQPVESP